MKSNPIPRSILIAASLAALVVPGVAITFGQQTVRVESSFVQMDAAVTDKDGNRIRGLTSANFRILEDGKQQKLTGVDFFDVSKAVATENVEPIYISLENPNDSETLSAIRSSHRLIVLFFDKSAMFPEDLIRAVDSAKEFVRNQMTSADLVTIATYGTQLIVKSDFTNDHAVLNETLDSLIPGRKTTTGAKATLDDSITSDNGITDTEHSLSATTALAQMLAQVPGRKSVIHFTGGLSPSASLGGRAGGSASVPMDRGVPNPRAGAPPIGPNIYPNIDAATNAANDSNASFYEVDARGLITICGAPPRDMPCACVLGRACYGVHGSRDTLYTLAADSGGTLFTDLNDFRPIYKAVQDASTGYYLLTFDPSNKKKDGSYRQIEIKLVNVPGGRITFRHGYYAPRK